MLNHLMSLFLVPMETCQELETATISFFWESGSNNGKGVKWMRWSRMAIPKVHGGLGYRDLHQFNLALVAKQGWRILQQPDTLASKVLKASHDSSSNEA